MPAFTELLISGFDASISFSSLSVGSPIWSTITLANPFESLTLNRFDFLLKKPSKSFRNTTPADQMSIFVS